MRTPETIKTEKIVNLEYCLEKLLFKENSYNEFEVRGLYSLLYHVICDMKQMDPPEAIELYKERMNADAREALKKYGIELVV